MIHFPNYASALRCIGQALELRGIDVFELTATETGEFLVEYADPDPPHTRILTIQFSPDNIEVLDREGQARRHEAKSEFRFDSLPEVLRAAGWHLDGKRAELRRLNNCCLSEAADLELEYQTRAGPQSATLARDTIRGIAMKMYRRRTDISNPIHFVTRRT